MRAISYQHRTRMAKRSGAQLLRWVMPWCVALGPWLGIAEAAVGQAGDKQLESVSVNEGGGVTASSNYRQQTAVGDTMSSGRLSSSRFRLAPGLLGSVFSGSSGQPLGELTIERLSAKTAPGGMTIAPSTWQRDRDPFFYWEPPPGATGIAGYSYAMDETPDDTVDTSSTSFDVAISEPGVLADGIHRFNVKAINTAGSVGAVASFDLWVDTVAPLLADVAPVAGALLNMASPTITAVITDAHSGVQAETIEVLIDSFALPVQFAPSTGIMTAQASALEEGTHVVKLRATDAAGNVQNWLLWSVTTDTIAPVGSVVINGGAEETASSYVTLTLSATDATSGVNRVLISNDPSGVLVEEPYIVRRELWLLTPVRGPRTVYVQFADRAGNVSAAVSDEIYLNLRAPETIITSGPAGFAPDPSASFTFICPEGTCLYSYAFDTAPWSSWDAQTTATAAALTYGNHVFRVKAAQDINGTPGIQPDEEDPTPAERAWVVGVQPSLLTVPRGPPIKLWRLE